MGKNKQQTSTEARAKKTTAQEVQPAAEQPKPEAKPTATPAPAVATTLGASKQDMAIAKLKEGWAAKGVNLDKLTIKDDGKFKLLIVDAGWPIVQIGPTGGIVLPQIRSYPKAYDAALIGKELFDKQQARDNKKATAPAPKAAAPEAVTA